MPRKSFLFLALLILLGAAFLRLADLSRYPTGLHYDEAADMLLGRDIAFHNYNPFPVVTAYSGREALFYYLSVPMLRILSLDGTPNVMATRLTSVFLGILTVAVTIILGRTMFSTTRSVGAGLVRPENGHTGDIIALLAGAWLAINGPQVWLTRQGFRTSPQPFLEALCLWLLMSAIRRGEHGKRAFVPLVLGGICGGLALYVYMAARIFPPWLSIPLAALILFDGKRRWLRIRQTAIFLAALAISAVPIVAFYAQHPDVFFDRLTQVASTTTNTPTLLESIGLHLKMFFIEGDPLLRYNLYPGRPYFDLISGVLMLIGMAAAVWLLIRRGSSATERTVAIMLLACPLLILPSVVAVSGLPPSHMRSVAMVPLILFLPALGAVSMVQAFTSTPFPTLWRRGVERRAGRHQPLSRSAGEGVGGEGKRTAAFFLILSALAILIVALGLNTWSDYQAWGARADVFYDSDGDLDAAARWLEQNARPDELIYVASKYYEHPTVFAHQLDPSRIRWMMEEQLILPPPDRAALYIFPRSIKSDMWASVLVGQVQSTEIASAALPASPDGAGAAFRAYRLSAGSADLTRARMTDINFGGVLNLRATNDAAVHPGECAPAEIQWEVLRTPDRADLAPVVSLYDAWGNEITRAYPYIEHTDRWLPGEWFHQRLCFTIPPGNPPGQYAIRVAWVGKNTPDYYVPRLDDQGRFAGIWVETGRVHLDLPSQVKAVTPPADRLPIIPGLYVVEPPELPVQIEQGDTLKFQVRWLATQALPSRAKIRLIAQRADATTVLWEGDPVHNTYPFARWQPSEQVIDRYAVQIPSDFRPGDHELRLEVDGKAAFTQSVTILAVERTFTPPDLANMVDYRVGDSIRLLGYGAIPHVEKGEITVTLAWGALERPDRDYTVFVHVVKPDETNFSQIDRQPVRPTSRWIANEVIAETYTLKIPDGPYRVRIGLYVQENGLRLPIRDSETSLGDALIIYRKE